jgi:50S ribosomal subunit-associated GTPase HflX
VAAAHGTGLELVRAALTSALWPELERATLHLDLGAAAVRSRLYADHRVRAERVREDGGWEMEVEVTPRQLEALARESGVSRTPASSSCVPDGASLQFRARKTRAAR